MGSSPHSHNQDRCDTLADVKILHTADWHAGRTLKGVNRTPEIREALREVAALAIDEQVDLVVVAGDLYDKKTPGADAEEAVYAFFLELGEAKIPSVVIAGNHDAPSRLDAVGGVLRLANARVLGDARVAGQGGAFEMHLGSEMLQVAALPFVSERRIVRYADLLGQDPGQWTEKYQQGMRKLVQNLTKPFHDDAVNLLVMHTTMEGSSLSRSEYTFHCTESYTVGADLIPHSTNYVALGHIHKPQAIQDFPDNAGRYAGSLLQLDFGEAGEQKYVYIVEAHPGQPTETVLAHPMRAGKPLKQVRVDLSNDADASVLDKKLKSLEDFGGYLKLNVHADRPQPGLKDRVKKQLPQTLAIELVLPETSDQPSQSVDLDQIEVVDAYQQYYQTQKGNDAPQDVMDAFRALWAAGDDEGVNA